MGKMVDLPAEFYFQLNILLLPVFDIRHLGFSAFGYICQRCFFETLEPQNGRWTFHSLVARSRDYREGRGNLTPPRLSKAFGEKAKV